MLIDWVPIGEEESFDCKAKLQELNEIISSKMEALDEGNKEVGAAVKEFKEIAGELAA